MKIFLSIGSGPGIGIATAERFAAEGFKVVLTSRDKQSLVGRAEQLRTKGYAVEVEVVDSGDLGSITKLIRSTEAKFGAIDVLHFNAASMRNAAIESQAPETFVPDLTVNIGSAGCQAGSIAWHDIARLREHFAHRWRICGESESGISVSQRW